MRSERIARVCLVLLAIPDAVVGVSAAFFPASFYSGFPGLGRTWVSLDGPFNEHLVRDVGQLNLALCLVLVVATARPLPQLVRTAAAASLVVSVPHFVYHLSHLAGLPATDVVGETVSLGAAVLIGCLALVAAAAARGLGADRDARPGLGAPTAP